MIPIGQHESSVSFSVRVHPRAKKNAITGEVGDALKVALTAPPVEGAANEAIARVLADALGVPARAVTVARGSSGRNKLVDVAGIDAASAIARLTTA